MPIRRRAPPGARHRPFGLHLTPGPTRQRNSRSGDCASAEPTYVWGTHRYRSGSLPALGRSSWRRGEARLVACRMTSCPGSHLGGASMRRLLGKYRIATFVAVVAVTAATAVAVHDLGLFELD